MPVLDDESVTVTTKEGFQAELPCPVTNKIEEDIVSWIRKTQVIFNGTMIAQEYPRFNITIKKTNNSKRDEWNLVINDVQTSDAATYQCMVQTYPPQMKNVQLKVTSPPRIDKLKIKDEYSFEEDDRMLIITCPVTGDPVPTVQWYRFKINNYTLIEEKDLIAAGANLTIKNPSKYDGGIYQCKANNSIGHDMYEVYIKALYKPMIKTTTEKIVVKTYETARLRCEVESNPGPSIKWLRESSVIKDTSKYKIEIYPENENENENETHYSAELIISDTQEEDEGEYECVASNKYGQNHAKVLMQINEHTSVAMVTKIPPTHPTVQTSAALSEQIVNVISTAMDTAHPVDTTTLQNGDPRTDASKNGCSTKENAVLNLHLLILLIVTLL